MSVPSVLTIDCTCSSLSKGATVSAYNDGSTTMSCEDTAYSFYGDNTGGSSVNAYEADFIWGAASMFSIPAMIGLGQAIQEHSTGGHLNNWFNMGSGATTDFLNDFANVTSNNYTGVTFTSNDVYYPDSINAAGAMWYLSQQKAHWSSTHSGNDLLCAMLTSYNAGQGYTHQLDGAYAYSVLWKAYGSNYASHSTTSWDGAYMATGPSGQFCTAANGDSNVYLQTPGYTVPRTQYEAPYGYNSSGHRTVLFTYATADYVSGLAIETWLYNSPYSEAYLTQGYDIAALTAKRGLDFCVIVVGGPAYTQIIDTANSLGFHLTAYSDFAAWRSGAGTNPGFVNADGSSANDSYNLGLTAAKAAADAGWA